MAVYTVLKRINDAICVVLQTLITILLTAMTILIFLQVIFRYVLKAPLSWSEELATYLFSIGTFLGSALVLRKEKHVRVTAVLNAIKSDTAQKVILIICDIVVLLLCLLLCVKGGGVVARLMKISQTSPSMPWLKDAYVNIFVPISMGLMVLVKAESVLKKIIGINDTNAEGKGEFTE